jgi:hypothetical protein
MLKMLTCVSPWDLLGVVMLILLVAGVLPESNSDFGFLNPRHKL